MRLINTKTRRMEEFVGNNIPPYAILSHTWEEEEVTFSDMMTNRRYKRKKGYGKIDMTCNLAVEDRLDYAWVDTCCIDKTSSAELSEAINSMYRWYQRSSICYAYLSDIHLGTHVEDGLKNCRWWTRGWTLQELIAPQNLEFYDRHWNRRGTKVQLVELIFDITGIDVSILTHTARLSSVPLGRRMAWAAGRETTRIEDRAYSLLGIFNVNMPLLYGEEEKAFTRLQEEIIKLTSDLSILAWNMPASTRPAHSKDMVCGILAPSPDYFTGCSFLQVVGPVTSGSELSISNSRLKIDAPLYPTRPQLGPILHYLALGCHLATGLQAGLGILLTTCGANEYARLDPWFLVEYQVDQSLIPESSSRYILTCVPEGYEAQSGAVGTCLRREFMLERRTRVPVLHIETPPEIAVTLVSRGGSGRYDPVDQIFHCPVDRGLDAVLCTLELSIKLSRSSLILSEPKVLKFSYVLMVANWSGGGPRLITDELQFSIFHFDTRKEVMSNLMEYLFERSDVIGTYSILKWLRGNDLPQVSSSVIELPDPRRPGLGVRVWATPRVVADPNTSKRRFVRVSVSWETGRMKNLSVSKRKPWDLS
ncbi:Heterokaryon incompatibility protein (HET) domain containing protein [Naviculisporaceae sp. PSN 640]